MRRPALRRCWSRLALPVALAVALTGSVAATRPDPAAAGAAAVTAPSAPHGLHAVGAHRAPVVAAVAGKRSGGAPADDGAVAVAADPAGALAVSAPSGASVRIARQDVGSAAQRAPPVGRGS